MKSVSNRYESIDFRNEIPEFRNSYPDSEGEVGKQDSASSAPQPRYQDQRKATGSETLPRESHASRRMEPGSNHGCPEYRGNRFRQIDAGSVDVDCPCDVRSRRC